MVLFRLSQSGEDESNVRDKYHHPGAQSAKRERTQTGRLHDAAVIAGHCPCAGFPILVEAAAILLCRVLDSCPRYSVLFLNTLK